MKKYIMEAVGTMFLVLTIALSGHAIAIGAMFAVLVFLGWNISGSHYNPAVSLAVWMRSKLSTMDFAWYVLAQIIGAFLAAVIYRIIAGNPYVRMLAPEMPWWKIFAVEMLFTLFFVFTILALALYKKNRDVCCPWFIIGFALMAIAVFGVTYNPAVAFGPALLELAMGGTTCLAALPVHVFGSLFGGVLASLAYKYMYED